MNTIEQRWQDYNLGIYGSRIALMPASSLALRGVDVQLQEASVAPGAVTAPVVTVEKSADFQRAQQNDAPLMVVLGGAAIEVV